MRRRSGGFSTSLVGYHSANHSGGKIGGQGRNSFRIMKRLVRLVDFMRSCLVLQKTGATSISPKSLNTSLTFGEGNEGWLNRSKHNRRERKKRKKEKIQKKKRVKGGTGETGQAQSYSSSTYRSTFLFHVLFSAI